MWMVISINDKHKHTPDRITDLVDPDEHGLFHVEGPLQLFGWGESGKAFKT